MGPLAEGPFWYDFVSAGGVPLFSIALPISAAEGRGQSKLRFCNLRVVFAVAHAEGGLLDRTLKLLLAPRR